MRGVEHTNHTFIARKQAGHTTGRGRVHRKQVTGHINHATQLSIAWHVDTVVVARAQVNGGKRAIVELRCQRRITAQLFELKSEHRDLDTAIGLLDRNKPDDELSVKRLKKRRLKIKDQIAQLENLLIPDLNA